MSRATRNIVITLMVLLLAVLIAFGVSWFRRNFHQVEHTYYLPPTGEAAYNPLYALKKSLEADGVRVDARQRLQLDAHPLAAGDTVLLFNEASGLLPSQRERLLDWVAEGGHLLVRTPLRSGWDKDEASPLLDELGITPTDDSGCVHFAVQGQESHVEFCRGRRFRMMDVEPELWWGDLKAGYAYARLAHGEGHVDVLADFDFMTNNGAGEMLGQLTEPPTGGLRDVTHAVLTRQILAPNYGKGTVHLIYAAETPSLLRTLLVRGWMVLIPLTLALLAWLWSRMQRFGPQLPTPPMERRSLLEHVRASGDHLFRYGRGALLYVAARQAFLVRLRRRDPVAAALAGEAQVEAIAARMAVAPDLVRKALQVPASHDRTAFRDRISTLIELRNRL